jgi:hypothetical protein
MFDIAVVACLLISILLVAPDILSAGCYTTANNLFRKGLSSNSGIILRWIFTLGGVVVSVLATGPKVAGSNPAEDDLRVIKSVARLPSEGQ